ncbi:MAG: hypothetical protein ACXWXJ_05710 [Aeromicrobium sp.]
MVVTEELLGVVPIARGARLVRGGMGAVHAPAKQAGVRETVRDHHISAAGAEWSG